MPTTNYPATGYGRWSALCVETLRTTGNVPGWYAEITLAYSGSHRHFYTLEHVDRCLREFDSAPKGMFPAAVEFSIWCLKTVHSVGQPDSGNNERKSAAFAKDLGDRMGLPKSTLQRVERLILSTQRHEGLHLDEQLLDDIDLSVFGQPAEVFAGYEEKILEEYRYVLPELSGKLSRFLHRPAIFQTHYFHHKYEEQARGNLFGFLKRLNT